jgi:hypothetical protein
VGLRDNLKTIKGWADEAHASAPKYARITRVGRRLGRFQKLGIEVHYHDHEPVEASTISWLPRGVTPQVGQDVAIDISSNTEATSYEILWDRPPQYGNPSWPGPLTPEQKERVRRMLDR